MLISAITIENFKSIKDPVRIELKPITLLFGPNSVGKSTVIQAFQYVREIMSNPLRDVDRTRTGGEHVRLGGFANIVHNHDLNSSMRFRFELSVGTREDFIADRFKDNDTIFDEILENFPDDKERVKEYYREQLLQKNFPWLEINIKQDSMDSQPYIWATSIGFGNETFLSVYAKQEEGQQKHKVNVLGDLTIDLEHSLLRKEDRGEIEILFDDSGYSISEVDTNKIMFLHRGDYSHQYGEHTSTLPRVVFECGYEYAMTGGEYTRKQAPECYHFFEEILNTIWNTHLDAVLMDLDEFRYIGPLRQIPDETEFKIYDTNNSRHWANGLMAWIYMTHRATEFGIAEINYWLSEKKFNTGYKIIKNEYKEIDIKSSLYKRIIDDSYTDPTSVKNEVDQLPIHSRLLFASDTNNILLNPKDIGVGISQLLPIIPLVLEDVYREGLVAIEQPELHIHPAMQAVLGDLFIEGLHHLECDSSMIKRFILETHSEHLLLRLLRRLRDPGDLDIFIYPDDLCINFLEPGKNGIQATRIRVTEEGEFKDPWPRGFFNERSEELF